jgi:hypothetical protein
MSETIKIMQSPITNFQIVQGERTTDLVGRFTKLDSEERENLLNETTSILSQCVPTLLKQLEAPQELQLDTFKVEKQCRLPL